MLRANFEETSTGCIPIVLGKLESLLDPYLPRFSMVLLDPCHLSCFRAWRYWPSLSNQQSLATLWLSGHPLLFCGFTVTPPSRTVSYDWGGCAFTLLWTRWGGTCVVPSLVLDSWLPRKQQIYPGEALCGVTVPWFHQAFLRGFDILWFVDNEAAASSLIRGSSRPDDVHHTAQLSHVLLHGLGCRAWIEWVDSESNPSDGLSRQGLEDPWTLLQGWTLAEYPFPAQLLPSNFLATFASHIGMTDSG